MNPDIVFDFSTAYNSLSSSFSWIISIYNEFKGEIRLKVMLFS